MKYAFRLDGLRYHDIHAKFHKDWFRHSKVDGGGYTDTMVISQTYFYFLKYVGRKFENAQVLN
jgi:hypothetical protein